MQELTITCENEIGRRARPTCGQRYIWRVLRELHGIETLNIPVVIEVTRAIDLATVKDTISWFVRRHDALRTLFPVQNNGEPEQVLLASVSIPVTIIECGDGSVEDSAESLATELENQPFDLPRDLPVRCGIVTSNGTPQTVVLGFSHMVADGWSSSIIHEDFSRALNEGIEGHSWPSVWSPFDQSDWELSSEGQDVLTASEEYWRSTVRHFPRAVFARQLTDSRTDQWHSAEIHSLAMGAAAKAIAARTHVSTATVLLTSLALILSRLVKTHDFCATILYCNRTTEEVQRAIGSFPQGTPVIVELDSGDFSNVLTNTHFNLMDAYPSAQVWVPGVDAILRDIGAQKGMVYEIDTSFNISHDATLDLSNTTHMDDIEAYLADAANTGRIVHEQSRVFDLHTFSVKSYSASEVFILADTNYIDKGDVTRILFCLEKLLTTLALDPSADPEECVTSFGIAAWEPSAEWQNIGGSWINLAAVRDHFLATGLFSDFAVFVGSGTGQMTAYCILEKGAVNLGEFINSDHKDLLQNRSTMIPHEFVLCAKAPGNAHSEVDWSNVSVVQRLVRDAGQFRA